MTIYVSKGNFMQKSKLSRTEWKVRVASGATFLATLAATVFLQTNAGDVITDLPAWVQVPAASIVLSAVTWLSGRAAKSRPDYLSASTVNAVEAWLSRHSKF